jgi:ABC-2 type transport system permease protein
MAWNAAHAGESMTRIGALIRKEFNQIRRDRRLAVALIVPPTLQLLLFGFALDATVSNLRLGVIDWSATPESRELIASFTESKSFLMGGHYSSERNLELAISRGKLDAGMIVPYDFVKQIRRGQPVDVQILLNAVNANTATIGQGYAQALIQQYNQTLAAENIRPAFRDVGSAPSPRGFVTTVTAFLYNPGLVAVWFIATGTFGLLLILNSSVVAATTMIKEREKGTVEQLLMTPASTTEIIVAKMTPLFLLLMVMVLLAIVMMRLVFRVPLQGSLFLLLLGAALCILSGIGLGTFIATFTKTAQQSQLTSFFVNPPLSTLSGSLTPVEAMPAWLQPVTWLDPIRHFAIIVRSVLLRGSGMDVLWPNFLALTGFTLVLVSLSVWRFRKQLG